MNIKVRPLLIGILCVAWLLPGLIAHDPWKSEEATTFGAVYEILQGGSWLIPHLAGEPFMDKPPLYYLTAAGSAMLFSPILPVHDGARLVAGLYVALALVFTALAARELHDRRHGLTAALLLLGCLGLVVRSHQLVADIAALAGFGMAYYGAALAVRRAVVGGVWVGTACGVVFMTLGIPEALMIAIVMAGLSLVKQHWRTRQFAVTVGVALIAALPWLTIWPLLLWQRAPALFETWVTAENLARLFSPRNLPRELLYYLGILPWYAFPVWPLALWALVRARRLGILGTPGVVLPSLGFLVTLVMLGGAAESRELYALPMLIPLTLLAVPGLEPLRRGAANGWYWFSIMVFTFFIIVGWFYWSALELGLPARVHAHLHNIRPGYAPGFRWLPFLLGVAYTAGWFGLLILLKRNAERPLIVWVGGITAVWALLATLFIGWIDTASSYRPMFASMQRALPAQYHCLASRDLGESQRALLHYFAGIRSQRVEVVSGANECDLLLTQGAAADDRAVPNEWKRLWEGHRFGDRDERFRLFQRRIGR